jgi:hypothetical protein
VAHSEAFNQTDSDHRLGLSRRAGGLRNQTKGLLRGAIHVGLDATPLVGTAKGVLEFFTGDLLPDKQESER